MRAALVIVVCLVPLAARALPEVPGLLDLPASPPLGWRMVVPLEAGPSALVIPATIPVKLPDGSVEDMDLEEYLKGVLPKEIGTSFPLEAQKAQAVAARSYAIYFVATRGPICTTTQCQVWDSIHYPETDAAVEATRGQVLAWAGEVAPVFFAASCGGHTVDAHDVWGGEAPWLTPVPCIENKVGACEQVCTPEMPQDDTCWGIYGHRIGLCQRGAQAMALCGHDHQAILAHYAGNGELVTGAVVSPDTVEAADVLEPAGAEARAEVVEASPEAAAVEAAEPAPDTPEPEAEDGAEPGAELAGGGAAGCAMVREARAPREWVLLALLLAGLAGMRRRARR